MCGIAGVLYPNSRSTDSPRLTQTITTILNSQQQQQRGPDNLQMETIVTQDLTCVLGHNRLNVVDLQPSSNQPMWDENKRYCIVFNGMLYNYIELRKRLESEGYSFLSSGDTEVVLKAFMHWRTNAFQYFNGMFAIALIDMQEQEVYFVRDRFGIKPLFYAVVDNKFYFASTTNALALALKSQPNLREIVRGCRYWCYGVNNETVYENIFSINPAEIITLRYNPDLQLSTKQFYNLRESVTELVPILEKKSIASLEEEIEWALTDAVGIRLRSDVPMGLSLSGGIDSALITNLAAKSNSNLMAFSFGSFSEKNSEAKNAFLAAKNCNIPLHYVYPLSNELVNGFWQTLVAQDAPFPSLSIVAQNFVFQAAKSRGIKVMLGGQGGDELFMGYRKYLGFLLQQEIAKRNYSFAASCLLKLTPTLLSEITRFPHYLAAKKRYTAKQVSVLWQQLDEKLHLGADLEKPLWYRQLADIYSYSLPSLLRYEDRNSMGNSIESRLPFLDYRLVELALALPNEAKLHRGYGKWLLRKIASRYIPEKICFSRVKRGFDVNTERFISAGIGKSIREKIKAHDALISFFAIENIDERFSDSRLIKQPERLAESISLAWLASKEHFDWSK